MVIKVIVIDITRDNAFINSYCAFIIIYSCAVIISKIIRDNTVLYRQVPVSIYSPSLLPTLMGNGKAFQDSSFPDSIGGHCW